MDSEATAGRLYTEAPGHERLQMPWSSRFLIGCGVESEMSIRLEEATRIQHEMASRVRLELLPESFECLGAVWVRFDSPEAATTATAVAVLLEWRSLRLVQSARSTMEVNFPYIPGLFAFRAMAPIREALQKLRRAPDVLLLNAQGTAHVRRFGMASYLGVLLDLPTVGCTRRPPPFPVPEPEVCRGATAPIRDGEDVVGVAVRVCDNIKPLYVSPGHRADLISSADLVLQCCRGCRMPEPLRLARALATG